MQISTALLFCLFGAIAFCQTPNATDPRCEGCGVIAKALANVVDQSDKLDSCLENIAVNICEILKIEDDTVCQQAVNEYAEEVIYIAALKLLSPNNLCGKILQVCPIVNDTDTQNWTLPMPGNKPNYAGYVPIQTSKPTLKVLHITDVHFDSEYLEGSESDCGEPLCCRNTAPNGGINNTVKSPAGRWGNNVAECDPPTRTIESAFQHISQTQDVDIIIWTGDMVAHNLWNYTRSGHIEAFNYFTNLLLQYFPSAAVYSATGNHEGVPCDQFAPKGVPDRFAHDWLYDSFYANWTHWLNGKEAGKDIRARASYMMPIVPGLRIISLNTIYAYGTNFWLLLNATDPDSTMTWFIDQLDAAEKAGDKVWIIGHIPNSSTMSAWSTVYYNAINRYEDTVRGQFYGHSHEDQFRVHYLNMDPTQRPTAITYIGPSVTTYSGKNPGYRIYTVDGIYKNSTYSVLDHDNYYLDLDKANANPDADPVWEFEYRASEAYSLANLNPQAWHDLTVRMQSDPSLIQSYKQYNVRKPDMTVNCDSSCAQSDICSIRRAIADDATGASTLCSTIVISSNYTTSDIQQPAQKVWKQRRFKQPFDLPDLLSIPDVLKNLTGRYC